MKRCQDSGRRIGWIALALLAGVASLIPVASSRAQESNQEPGATAPPEGRLSPGDARRSSRRGKRRGAPRPTRRKQGSPACCRS